VHTLGERTANIIWQISAHKFGLNFVGEMEWQIFLTNVVPFCLANNPWQTIKSKNFYFRQLQEMLNDENRTFGTRD
jgi:hypothetical protein